MPTKLDIFYFGNIYDVNGINFVTNLFLKGKEVFKDNDIILHNIYSSSGTINCDKTSLINIGKDINKSTYKNYRKVRILASKLFSSKIKYFSWLKIKFSIIIPAKKVVYKHSNNLESNVIIFQDIFTAYYYLTKKNSAKIKTILVLHCERNPFEQLLKYYPSLMGSKYHHKLQDIQKRVYTNIDQVVFLSKVAYNNNKEIINKSLSIYNGIPDLPNHNFKTHLGTNIVCVGSMTGHKGQEILIQALALLKKDFNKNLNLHLIGSGPQEESLKNITKKLGLNDSVFFYGVRNDVDTLLKKMDIMVLPSKSEGMPLAILEGMRQGMYILATKVGAIGEMINSDFGDFVIRDPKDIALKIKQVVLDNKTDIITKQASRDFYLNNFTLDKMIEKYSSVVKKINDGL